MRPTPIALILLATFLAACSKKPATPSPPATPSSVADDIRTLVAKEELIPVLETTLAALDTPIPVFPGATPTTTKHSSTGILTRTWQSPTATLVLPSDFDDTTFTIVDGSFSNGDTFIAQVQLTARHNVGTTTRAFTADLTTTFTRSPDNTWTPTAWKTDHATQHTTAKAPLFTRLPVTLPSQHHKILLENYFPQSGQLPEHFTPDALNTHPAIAVADIDNDGFDDLYVTTRHGPNFLLVKTGDRTFRERAAAHGLAITGGSSSATFADFDNDGDPDLVLGRSHEPSLYLINHDGHFEPADPQPDFPALVTSTTTADVNRDGLLDVFFTTYSPLDLTTRTLDPGATPAWASHHLDPETAAEVARRNVTSPHPYLAQTGPPDHLFLNTGHHTFAPAPPAAAAVLAGYTNSFQATFHDIDRDGDPDLYIASDFSPDRLLRNDTPMETGLAVQFPIYTDITPANLPFGFGMGAAFADVDNDNSPELYTSNMYSKAGRRITAQLPGLDPRLRQAADGNRLFRISATGTLTLDQNLTAKTANAQWSWGGAFADFDNDTFPDLYVPAGYYTAPPGHAVPVDL